MKDLIQNIEQWAEARNLIHGSTPEKQTVKLIEEIGELAGAIARQNNEKIRDSIGDSVVVTVILAKQSDVKIHLDQFGFATQLYQDVLHNNPTHTTEQLLFKLQYAISDYLGYNEIDDEKYINVIFMLLYHISLHLNFDFTECTRFAYNQIKDRKGKMVDGVFVKEEDLQNE